MTPEALAIQKFDRIWQAILAENCVLEPQTDRVCDACEKLKHNVLVSEAGRCVCRDCHTIIPELHACGTPNSPLPQGEWNYRIWPGPNYVKKCPSPKPEN